MVDRRDTIVLGLVMAFGSGVLISAVILTVFSWLIFVYGLKLTIPVWPKFIG